MEPENKKCANKANSVLGFISRKSEPQEPSLVLEIVQEFSTSNTPVLLSTVVSTLQKGFGYFRESTTQNT